MTEQQLSALTNKFYDKFEPLLSEFCEEHKIMPDQIISAFLQKHIYAHLCFLKRMGGEGSFEFEVKSFLRSIQGARES